MGPRRAFRGGAWIAAWGAATLASRGAGATPLEPHLDVRGPDVAVAEVRPRGGSWEPPAAWDVLTRLGRAPGDYDVRWHFETDTTGSAVRIPVCAGRGEVFVDGHATGAAVGPKVLPLNPGAHDAVVHVRVNLYERRIACGEPLRVGGADRTIDGLGVLHFPSPEAAHGGGDAVVFIPPGHDARRAGALLVGAHPWNGSIWTYAAYAELLRAATARDVLLLMPSGLGNSLYTADAEREVLRAIAALSATLAVDPRAISIWGASMGGAGATTIAFHHPDQFATVTSFFGDSKYDLSTYAKAILPNPAAAHRVNALDIADNGRNLPVWLVHGEDDRTSPIAQSELLAAALAERGFSVRFDRVPGIGHAGALVSLFLPDVVATAATARVPESVSRVTYRSVRPSDLGAYGVRIVRKSTSADAFVDIEKRTDAVHVLQANGLTAIALDPGALATSPSHPPPIVVDPPGLSIHVAWNPPP